MCLQRRERGVSSLLSLLATDDSVGQTISLFGLGPLRKAGECLTDNCIQLGPDFVRSRSFEGDEFRARRGLGCVIVEERGGSLVEFFESESECFL